MHLTRRVKTVFILLAGAGLLIVAMKTPAFTGKLFPLVVELKCKYAAHNKIIAGRNGWLFFEPELTYVVDSLPKENIRSIIEYDRTLRSQGISLFVVPIPNKVEIYPEMLTSIPAPEPVKKERSDLLDTLERAGVRVIDLVPAFEQAKSHCQLYDPYETHWSAAGIEVAAGVIAQRVDSLLDARHVPRTARYAIRDTVRLASGDLIDRLKGERWCALHPVNIPQVYGPDGTPYKDDVRSGIMIIGDSYVDHIRWWNSKLGAHLARQIGHPTYTYCNLLANVKGPCMYDMKPEAFPKHGIVIWAFTSRVLQMVIGCDKGRQL
jgi:hypothetical protein